MKNNFSFLLVGIFLVLTGYSYGQQRTNLNEALENQQIEAVNKSISPYGNDSDAVEMTAANSDGLGILKGTSFEQGTVEIELLGENNPGKSFIGVAFNIQDEETYEAIYFRPFNFVAEEQVRKDHMVQYINHPDFTWKKLRNERPGVFEAEIPNPPDPDGWFKARLDITDKTVTVYVNDRPDPVLTIERLAKPLSKKIGLWTGFGSSGRFKDLGLKKE
jgi:hypothetical protein